LQQQESSMSLSEQSKVLRIAFVLAIGVAVGFGAFNSARAQSTSPHDVALEVSASDGRWTALTIAPDGSWGVATESMSNRAIANAIAECRFKYRRPVGCGGYQIMVQQGWILAIRCGDENILAAARDLAEAERSAARSEDELRRIYVPDMPACRKIVTIDPRGMIIVPVDNQITAR
jgi:hypothetical protein